MLDFLDLEFGDNVAFTIFLLKKHIVDVHGRVNNLPLTKLSPNLQLPVFQWPDVY